MILREQCGELAELIIQHEKPQNPFSAAMTRELTRLCGELEADDAVEGVLLWGGEDRSFSVGGDFRDLQSIRQEDQMAEYLRDIVRSYQAVLAISKPVVTAIDHHAIGQGLQVALMGDWRVGSDRSQYRMPELANGMPCPLGSAILESLLGRADMLHLVVGCEKLDAEQARRSRLLDEICPPAELRSTALARLATFCRYPRLAFRLTKRIHNARLSQVLENVRETAAAAHVQSFVSGQADAHFAKIVGKGS